MYISPMKKCVAAWYPCSLRTLALEEPELASLQRQSRPALLFLSLRPIRYNYGKGRNSKEYEPYKAGSPAETARWIKPRHQPQVIDKQGNGQHLRQDDEGQWLEHRWASIDDRYNRKATILASQLPISDWYNVFQSGLIAEACLDRIVNKAMKFCLSGESLRKKY